MENPVQDVRAVVHNLTQGSPSQQEDAINRYFTPDASFTHPFCRTGSFEGSRHLVHRIYRWYKIMSPKIELQVNSIAYDETNMILYVNISQVFAIWFIPLHRSAVNLTTVLHLTRSPDSGKYYIQSQNDLYQVEQFFQFFAPWGIGTFLVIVFHFWATFLCVLAAQMGKPYTDYLQRQWAGKQHRKVHTNGVSHPELDQEHTGACGHAGERQRKGVTTPSRSDRNS